MVIIYEFNPILTTSKISYFKDPLIKIKKLTVKLMKAILFSFLVLALSNCFVKANEKELTSDGEKNLHLTLSLSSVHFRTLVHSGTVEVEEIPAGLKILRLKERPPLQQQSTITGTEAGIQFPLQENKDGKESFLNISIENK